MYRQKRRKPRTKTNVTSQVGTKEQALGDKSKVTSTVINQKTYTGESLNNNVMQVLTQRRVLGVDKKSNWQLQLKLPL